VCTRAAAVTLKWSPAGAPLREAILEAATNAGGILGWPGGFPPNPIGFMIGMSHGLTACEVSLEVFVSKRCVRSCAPVSSAPSRPAGFSGTYLKFTDSGPAALFA
jgi:hypothetical protein